MTNFQIDLLCITKSYGYADIQTADHLNLIYFRLKHVYFMFIEAHRDTDSLFC